MLELSGLLEGQHLRCYSICTTIISMTRIGFSKLTKTRKYSYVFLEILNFSLRCFFSYVVVEQLKTMLSVQDTGTPFYLAANDKEHPSIIGDVYVFNRAAIRRLVHHFRHPDVHQSSDEADCKRWGHFRNSGKSSVVLPTSFNRECLHRLGIVSYNTRDERGCERFLSNRLATELANHVNLVHSGDRCISRTAVIFRGVQYNQFHVYEHMLYRLKIIPDVLRQ